LGLSMAAYPGVVANFPTALQAAPPYGPRHGNAPAFFILGAATSAEEGAEIGADDDIDGLNNILPAAGLADNDGRDDGLTAPETFEHCQPVTLSYEVTVLSTYGGPMVANLWADWDHNGAWGGGPPAACPGIPTAPEWVVQNQPLNLNIPGTYVFTAVFTPWYPDPYASTWLRLSVSEQAAGGNGSGPMGGYQYGETEDYLVPGSPRLVFLPMIQGGNNNPPPTLDPHTHVDPDVPPAVIASWPQLPDEGGVASVPGSSLILRLKNNGDFSGEAMIDLTVMVNGTKSLERIGPVALQPGPWTTDVPIDLPQGMSVRSPGTMLAEVHVTPDGGGQGGDPPANQPFDTPAGQFYFHDSTTQPGRLVIYGDEGYRAQIEAQAFVDNSGLWSRLSANFPGPIPAGMAQINTYIHGDPVLMEGAPDEGHDGLVAGDGVEPADNPGGNFTLCLEWYTAPVDNDFGEDYGLNDDGWRARGAKIRVYYSGGLVFDSYLNTSGCAVIEMNGGSGGLAHIEFDGRSRLAAGAGYNYLRRMWAWEPPDTPSPWTTATDIYGVQSGATYRPEMSGNDAFSILSYAAQERFNGGVTNENIYLVKAICNLTTDDSCSTYYDGRHTLFIKSSQWQRKYVAGHEFGHKILALDANYVNDCSSGGSGHGMNGTEYASCAAMEGWAHFVAADIWNNHSGSDNPGAIFVYWNGTVYDVELQNKKCYDTWTYNSTCDGYGVEGDWMRFWWDFHTNDLPSDPGSPPNHGQLFDIIDDLVWDTGNFEVSNAFMDMLTGDMATRWDAYACWNGIGYDHCQ
ncbi:MAG: GEVED domain-containing protein, partial [Chloroflexi bacterium]|nr:GEVED domain-containing protein [Chloroflexota bacterium]